MNHHVELVKSFVEQHVDLFAAQIGAYIGQAITVDCGDDEQERHMQTRTKHILQSGAETDEDVEFAKVWVRGSVGLMVVSMQWALPQLREAARQVAKQLIPGFSGDVLIEVSESRVWVGIVGGVGRAKASQGGGK